MIPETVDTAVEIEEGNIVKVYGTETSFDGAYGIVGKVFIGEEKENVGVTFGKDKSHLFGFQFKKNGIMMFSDKNLEVVEDFPVEVKAEHLFKGSYMVIRSPKEPLDKNSECRHDNCLQKAEKRAMVNIWGSVCEVDVCSQHFDEYNGHLIDSFPWKD